MVLITVTGEIATTSMPAALVPTRGGAIRPRAFVGSAAAAAAVDATPVVTACLIGPPL